MSKPSMEPCIFVVVGGTGDLMHRKLLPALYNLVIQGLLPERFPMTRSRPSAVLATHLVRPKTRGLPTGQQTG